MYKQEIETLLNLDHKNVIDLFAYLEVDTYLYIMMNYMKNGTVSYRNLILSLAF